MYDRSETDSMSMVLSSAKQALMDHCVPPSLGKGVQKPKKLEWRKGNVSNVSVRPSTVSQPVAETVAVRVSVTDAGAGSAGV